MSDTPKRDAINNECVTMGVAQECLVWNQEYAILERTAAALARDLEGACRRLAELGEPMSKPQSLVDWDKMKEGV